MRSQAILSVLASFAAAGVIAGCGQDETPTGADDEPGTAAAAPTTEAPVTNESPRTKKPSHPDEPPTDEPAVAASEHRVTYDWAAPSEQVTIEHPSTTSPPHLVAIYAGDHPTEEPPYQRIAFYFRGGFPWYELQYVPSVLSEATGEPVALDGNAFLRIGFVNAQAHDDAGESTIAVAPNGAIGFQNLKSYRSAGDFEGHLTYGLGLQVAPNSDQVLLVRAGELIKADDAAGTYYVVYIDIETG